MIHALPQAPISMAHSETPMKERHTAELVSRNSLYSFDDTDDVERPPNESMSTN